MFFAPGWIVLGVNNICNLHCKMCDVGTQNLTTNFATNLVGTHPINMPRELCYDIMDQTSRYFPTSKIGYGFTEPLIYPHLMDTLDYANKKNLFTSITTNALNLSHKAEGLVKSGLNEINISLDGPEAIHNHIRGHKSSFQRAIKGIESLLASKNPPTISVYCVITEWNIGHLKEFADYFKSIPIERMGFMHTNFTPDEVAADHNAIYASTYKATASNVDEVNIDNMNMADLWEDISAIKSDQYDYPVIFSPEVNSFQELEKFYHQPDQLFGKRCSDAFSNIMIKSDGSVIPAHGRCYNLTIGNLHEESLKSIWNSEVITQFRKTLNTAGGLLPACSRCCSAFGS